MITKKKSWRNLEAVTDFERRYGTERSYGKALINEQNRKFKNQIKELKEQRNKLIGDNLALKVKLSRIKEKD
jgi:hypothetical protein